MKIYIINEGYTFDGAKKLRDAHKLAFDTRQKAVNAIKDLIGMDKAEIDHTGKMEFREECKDGRYWLYWKNGSHCWEIHELEVR